jgi:acyl-[acyl-carrier-protein] desaturase
LKDSVFRERVYRVYLDFLKSAETRRRWNIFNDIPWNLLEPAKAEQQTILAVEHTCTEEMYLPDYGSNVMHLLRASFGHAWFWANWTYEESMHGLALREYLLRSGHRSTETMTEFENQLYSVEWKLPFTAVRQMTCYGALQETATYLGYKLLRERAIAVGDRVLETIFSLIGRDEAAHAGFYRSLMTIEMERDREGTTADMVYVIPRFKMPGDGLVPNYHARLQAAGLAYDSVWYVEKVVMPTLKASCTSWQELRARSGKAERTPASS